MAQPTPEETTALLTRLAQKPGVTSTLILSRSTGAVVRASGLISSSPGSADVAAPSDAAAAAAADVAPQANGDGALGKGGLRSADDVARIVWRFFGQAGGVVDDMMGTEDEVRLLRLRTKRNELVVVPDANFLLVVIHDTPPA